jgi:pilus assembly protein CpaC
VARSHRKRIRVESFAKVLVSSSLCLSSLLFLPVQAQESTPAAVPSPKAVDDPRKDPYRRSRTTRDETEMTVDRRDLLLNVGEDRIVDLDFEVGGDEDRFFQSSNPAIVRAQLLVMEGKRQQLLFKPGKKGETNVIVRGQNGKAQLIFHAIVLESNLETRARELRDLLRDVEGIEIKVVGQKVVIDGEILVPADYGRLVAITMNDVYVKDVLNLTMVSPIAMQVIADRIDSEIKKLVANPKPGKYARIVNGMIFLEGEVDSEVIARRAVEIAKAYLPEVAPANPSVALGQGQRLTRSLIQNFLMIKAPPAKKQDKLVRVTVHYVELNKEYGKVFGFRWQPSFISAPQVAVGTQDNGAVGASSADFSFVLSNLLPRLESAQSAGYARILRTGTLITRSGQAASLEDSKQIAFITLGGNGQPATQFAPLGLNVSVTPQVLSGQAGQEDIQMDLKMSETGQIGRAPATGAPLTATHKVETKVYVRNNESAAIVGVTSTDIQTNFNKDAPGGAASEDSAPLFNLTRAKQFSKQKGQFVIFVTPQIIENASDGTEDLKKNFRVRVK